MSQRKIELLELALKKQQLLMHSAALRTSLAGHAQTLKPLFSLADRGSAALCWLRRHPAVPVAVLVATLVARPRGVLRWARRGWIAWQSFGKLRSFLAIKLAGDR